MFRLPFTVLGMENSEIERQRRAVEYQRRQNERVRTNNEILLCCEEKSRNLIIA